MLTRKSPEGLGADPKKKRSLWSTIEDAATSRARTQLSVVQAQATQARMEELEDANPGAGLVKKFIADGGGGLCSKCAPFDGKLFPIRGGPRVPIHPHCRCS